MISTAFHAMFNGKHARCAFAMVVIAAAATGCNDDMGPLHKAAATGDVEVVRSWIANKRNLDATYDEPSTTLESNYAREQGVTALMIAARMGRLEIVKLLVEGGANVYAESHWRNGSNPRTAFDYAVENAVKTRRMGAVEYLWTKSDGIRFASRLGQHIRASCDRTCDDKFGGDAHTNLALFLISIAHDDAAFGKGISEAACFSQQPLRLLAFLEKHAVRFPSNTLHCVVYDPTVRHLRSLEERIAMASFFLDHGADLEDPGAGFTPLMGAAFGQEIEMVKFLLARGANPNTRNSAGITAIGVAANTCVYDGSAAEIEPGQKPQLAVIEYLARSGADTKLYTSEGARSRLQILTNFCKRTPHSATQQRICEVFGL
jgi:hypothetical protein